MPKCAVCDVELQPEQKTCHNCGSNVEATESSGADGLVATPLDLTLRPGSNERGLANPTSLPGERECPACGKVYEVTYQDEFCPCGTELQPRNGSASTVMPLPNSPTPVSEPLPSPSPTIPTGTQLPQIGTVCLVVYSETKPRHPVRYIPLGKDVTAIGREDALRGDFPDVDLSSFLDDSLAKKVSRRHAEVLRSRDLKTFVLRPLPGNTGTQVGKELAQPGQDYPLIDGTPIIFGGVVWTKFETVK